MKSEIEIKNMRDFYKEIVASGSKITSDNKSKRTKFAIEENKRIVKMLDWVLEDSELKRTVSDLTEEELKQLADILWLKYDDDCTVYEHILYFETLQKFAERLQQMLSKPKGEIK